MGTGMLRLPVLILILGAAALGLADDKWTYIKSGPFEVWTDGNDRPARQRLVEAEQLRYTLGQMLAKDDLKSTWRIRILAASKGRVRGELHRVRDLWVITVPAEEPLNAAFRRQVVRILLDSNTRAFPKEIDDGIIGALSALEVNGTRLKLGAPSPKTLEAARVHLFLTDPTLAGRARVFFSNLESGGDLAVAVKNAFGKPAAEIEKQVAAHFAESEWEASPLPGRAMSEKDFQLRPVPQDQAAIARADMGDGGYEAIPGPDALESAGDPVKAVEAGSKSATAYLAATAKTSDTGRQRALLAKAAELNPLWGEPHAALAKLNASTPAIAATEWGKAAVLDLRNVAYWQSYAEASTAANQFAEAAKAWNGAQRAAQSEVEKERLRAARARLEEQRADFTESERKRVSDERTRDLARVKQETYKNVREAEAKANARLAEGQKPVEGKVEEWWDGPPGPKQSVSGTLLRVDCGPKGQAKLLVRTNDGKQLTLLVVDPGKVAILNLQSATFPCGPLNPAKAVVVEFHPETKAVQTIEFR